MKTKIAAALFISAFVTMPAQAVTREEACASAGKVAESIASGRDAGFPPQLVLTMIEDAGITINKDYLTEVTTQIYSEKPPLLSPKIWGSMIESVCLKNSLK